jgi:hypothetical protein
MKFNETPNLQQTFNGKAGNVFLTISGVTKQVIIVTIELYEWIKTEQLGNYYLPNGLKKFTFTYPNYSQIAIVAYEAEIIQQLEGGRVVRTDITFPKIKSIWEVPDTLW